MKDRTAILISVILHVGLLLYLTMTPKAQFLVPDKFIPISVNEVVPPPKVNTPKPEPPKQDTPKPEPTVKKKEPDLDKIKEMLKEKLTPTPTRKPTEKPTPKPTQKPTPKPTPAPTRTPTVAPTRTPTSIPTPEFTKIPLTEMGAVATPSITSITDFMPSIQQDPNAAPYNFNSYASRLNFALARAWQRPQALPPELKDYITVISFDISRSGVISNIKIDHSSGWPLMDQTVYEAVQRAQIPPLPSDYTANTIRAVAPFLIRNK